MESTVTVIRENALPTMIIAIAIIFSPISNADVLVLNNGDRISGEIKNVWDAEISIEPTYADEFNVDIDVIAFIESDHEFEIELTDGREVVAKLSGADADGNQILEVDGQQIVTPLASLYELSEIDDRVDWDSYIDWSTAVNSGNTESLNTRLRVDSTLQIGDHRHIGDLTFVREEQDSDPTKEQDLLRYNYNWLFRDPWFFSAAISIERDPIRELDHRAVLSVGVGRDIWNRPRLLLNMQVGAGIITEKIGNSNEDSSVLIWGLRYRQELFKEDLTVFHDNNITHYVNGRNNTIYKTSTGLRYEITDLLYTDVSLDFDYETHPVSTAENEDLALMFGFGIEF
jgi:putative salt-induced outer membrane protein YdiY